MARLIDAYADGLLERREFEPRLRRAKGRLEKLKAEAEALVAAAAEEQQVEAVLGQWQEFAQRVAEGLAATAWPTRREIIRALVGADILAGGGIGTAGLPSEEAPLPKPLHLTLCFVLRLSGELHCRTEN